MYLAQFYLTFIYKCLPGRSLEDSRFSDTINGTPYLDDAKINILLFADDLTIFSLAREDLQKRMSILEHYSNDWGLELILSKKKNILFNKYIDFDNTKEQLRKFKFSFERKEIEIVKQYTYLGFTFMSSGKRHQRIENSVNK